MTTYTQEFKNYSLDLVEKSTKSVDYLSEPSFRKELSENIQNIFSASKMEGQIDIVIYTEYLLNFCNALEKGGIILNSKVFAGISQSLKELESKIKDHEYSLNTNAINELRSMLKHSYIEENDFIIIKKIQVLLIDKDSFSHYNIKKNGGNYITFDSVSTLEEATEKLHNNNYDLILSDFSIIGIAALFSVYSKKVPIVILSTSDSTGDAQLAARMGAIDYIIKNDDGMKLIQRTLHTAVGQWRRKSKEENYY